MANVTALLQIDPAASQRVEHPADDLWCEIGAAGGYSDVGGEAEAELLEALRRARWEDVVRERFAEQNPWLYSVISDPGRGLFLDVLPVEQGGTCLDVGSGWGQVAIPLSRQGTVFCLDLTRSRLEILREIARQEDAPLQYVCGNFRSFPFAADQFDLVIFNGSLEWLAVGDAESSIWEVQCAALRKTKQILKPGGLVYVGIENSLGLKYLLGAPDDHSGISHLTFLGEDAARDMCAGNGGGQLRAKTWSLREYEALFEQAGLKMVQAFGCFPDYKLIRKMIPLQDVDGVLADSGLPAPEHSGIDGAPLPFGDRLDALYRLLARNGIARYFCPSYALIGERNA
jgi:SAM-dependent methyltransferase